MSRAVLPLLAISLLLALSAAGDAPAAASKHCKAIRYAGQNYPVWVTQGTTPCTRARSTLLGFMKTKKNPSGWVCFRGTGFVAFAASCARRPGKGASAIIRAYNPGFGKPR